MLIDFRYTFKKYFNYFNISFQENVFFKMLSAYYSHNPSACGIYASLNWVIIGSDNGMSPDVRLSSPVTPSSEKNIKINNFLCTYIYRL